jgi:hypothetical protein
MKRSAVAMAPERSSPRILLALLTAMSWVGCGGGQVGGQALDAGGGGDGRDGGGGSDGMMSDGVPQPLTLVINELCADDDGFQIDEAGQTDDWIEIANTGATAVDLAGWTLDQGQETSRRHPLPALTLLPGKTLLLWADGSPEQGARHLDFKLAAKGGKVALRAPDGGVADVVAFPALATNQTFARYPDGSSNWKACRYATPGRSNGSACGPPPPAELPTLATFTPYPGPPIGAAINGPLVISEAALRPAQFIEILNAGAAPLPLADFSLRVAATGPGLLFPGVSDGIEVPWPASPAMIAPGARVVVPVAPEAVAQAAARPGFEAIVSLFQRAGGQLVQRLDVLRLPENAALALGNGATTLGGYHLCGNPTPGADDGACVPLAAREVGDRLSQILTAGDLAALAAGDTELDSLAVKVVVDMAAGDDVHFLAARRWPLHYTFIREQIYGQPALDRCDPIQAQAFDTGWREFSDREYFMVDGRRFLLATLVRHGGSGMATIEFDRSDLISAAQMRRGFMAIAARLPDAGDWSIRAQGDRQVAALKTIEGTVPIVDANAPFRGVSFQVLTPGIGYGILRFVPAAELGHARLGLDVIVVTDDVPNDVPVMGGLITEAFQTPLSHVSVLTRNRGTPDMALTGARGDARIAPLFEKLVRIEVGGGKFSLQAAEPAEAQAFWEKRRPKGPRIVPRLDPSLRGLQDLHLRSLDDLPALGGKAAQLAELLRVSSSDEACPGAIPTPQQTFGIPLVHGIEHFEASGARARLDSWRAQPGFATDAAVRAQALAEVRGLILAHPVDPALLTSIEAMARARFGSARFRLRSSSNTEDLTGFSGAGLYTSVSAALGDPDRPIDGGLRTVWASLWDDRAYDERELGNIDQDKVAMGILIHEAYDGVERANGVVVSRDVHNPIEASVVTINVQAGEASVTNPAPGVTSEELTYSWWKTPPTTTHSRSSLIAGSALKPDEIARLGCYIRAVETHFRVRLDPLHSNRWFTMESEFKFVGPQRAPILKQARPYSFGTAEIPVDCREF